MNPTVLAIIEMIPLTAAVVFYWNRAMKLSWDGRPVPVWRQVCFGTGLILAAFVLFNPWGYLAEELVIAREHLGRAVLIDRGGHAQQFRGDGMGHGRDAAAVEVPAVKRRERTTDP